MSIEVMTDVWKHSQARSGDLLVQLALADFSNHEGVAFPSITTLGRKARLSPRQVKRAIGRLQRLGELTVLKKQGPYGVNMYRIIWGDKLSLHSLKSVDNWVPNCHCTAFQSDILGKRVVTPTSPNPIKNPSKIKKRSGEPVDTVDNRDEHGEVATVGEGAKDLINPIGNPLNFLSPGLQESFSKHLEDDPS